MSSRVRIVNLRQPNLVPRIEAVLFWLWLIPLALAPVWFGSNLALAWGAHATIFGLLLGSYGACVYFGDSILPVPLTWIAFPLAALGLVLGWALLQTVPGIPLTWEHPVWPIASSVLGEPLAGTISVYPAATDRAVLWTATVAAAFVMAIEFGRAPQRAWLITLVLTLAGGAVAAYGLIVYALGNHWVLWEPKIAYLNALTATFIDRDNYAAFAAATLTANVALFFSPPPGRFLANERGWHATALLILLAATFLLSTASLLLTGSRAGVGMATVGIVLVGIFQIARTDHGRWKLLLVAVLGTAVLAGLVYFLGDLLLRRLADVNGDFFYRLALDKRMLAGVAASPSLGYGYGAFEQAFPMFRDTSLMANAVYQYGHNDWLEAIFTLGIPGSLILWSVFLWILVRCVKGSFGTRERAGFPALGVALLVAAGLDLTLDFSLQIQGFALPFMTLLGVGVAQSWPARP